MGYDRKAKGAAFEAGKAWAIKNGFLHPVKVDAFGTAWERVYLLHGEPTESVALKVVKAELQGRGRSQSQNQSDFGLPVRDARCLATTRDALRYRATHKPTASAETRHPVTPSPAIVGDAVPVTPSPAIVGDAVPVTPSPAIGSTSAAGLSADALVRAVLASPEARAALVRGLLESEV